MDKWNTPKQVQNSSLGKSKAFAYLIYVVILCGLVITNYRDAAVVAPPHTERYRTAAEEAATEAPAFPTRGQWSLLSCHASMHWYTVIVWELNPSTCHLKKQKLNTIVVKEEE